MGRFYFLINLVEKNLSETINVSSNPTDWFGGESDTIGAKSKTTLLGVHEGDSSTLGMFGTLFFSWFEVNRSILWQFHILVHTNDHYTYHKKS